MIPKILHQIWIGDEPFPEKFKPLTERLTAMHPSWEYRLWGEDAYELFGGKRFFLDHFRLHGTHPANLSELLRVKILHAYGGLYMDLDSECLAPFDTLLDTDFLCAVVGINDRGAFINNCLLGASVGSRMMACLLDGFESRIDVNAPIQHKYGFRYFNDVIMLNSGPDVTICGPKVIDAYYRHLYENSWCKDGLPV